MSGAFSSFSLRSQVSGFLPCSISHLPAPGFPNLFTINAVGRKKCLPKRGEGCNLRFATKSALPLELMTPTHAIAESERPPNRPFAAVGRVHSRRAVLCYESFTLNALLFGRSLRTFARVMNGRKPTSHTATAGVFPLRACAPTTIFAATMCRHASCSFRSLTSAN